jgi:hypothetical protein
VSFLAASGAGLEMLLDLDDLRFLEHLQGVGETFERLVHLLDLAGGAEDEVRKLAGALVVTRAVAPRADLLGLDDGKNRAQFSSDTLLGR